MNTTSSEPPPFTNESTHSNNDKHLLKKKSVIYDKEGNEYKKKLRKIFSSNDLENSHPHGKTSRVQQQQQQQSLDDSNIPTTSSYASFSDLIHHQDQQQPLPFKPYYKCGDVVQFRDRSQTVTQIGFVYHKKASALHEKERVPKCVVYMLSDEKYWILEWLLMKENDIEVGERTFEATGDSSTTDPLHHHGNSLAVMNLNNYSSVSSSNVDRSNTKTIEKPALLPSASVGSENNSSHAALMLNNGPCTNQSLQLQTTSCVGSSQKNDSLSSFMQSQTPTSNISNHSTITSRFNALHQQMNNTKHALLNSAQLSPFSHGVAKSLIHTATTAHGCNALMHHKGHNNILSSPASLQKLSSLLQLKHGSKNVVANFKDSCLHDPSMREHQEQQMQDEQENDHTKQSSCNNLTLQSSSNHQRISNTNITSTLGQNLLDHNIFRPICTSSEDLDNLDQSSCAHPTNQPYSKKNSSSSFLFASQNHNHHKSQLAHYSVLQPNINQSSAESTNRDNINNNTRLSVSAPTSEGGAEQQSESELLTNQNNNEFNRTVSFQQQQVNSTAGLALPSNNTSSNNNNNTNNSTTNQLGINNKTITIPPSSSLQSASMNQFFIQPTPSTDQSSDANSNFKKQIMLNHIHQRQQLVNQQLGELLNQQKRASSLAANSGNFAGSSQNVNGQMNVLNMTGSNALPSHQYNIQPSSGPFSQTTILFFNHNFELRPTDLLQFLVIQVKDGQTLKASCLNPVVSYDNETLLMLNEISNRVNMNSLSSLDEELSKFVHSSPLLISMPPQDEPCSVLLVLMKNFVPVTSPLLFEYMLP
ncbi:hypothetical protein FDP41_004016 [Naegleria fowleri]|uniref:Uncharacterized protein n=1 Tax=Naegleria fowleri TaxID=5763 RepID=A0A6A5BR35_NAEFO|nr:uncharacterized protein FDP41_004016 [Naegleria fowleri]KAF0976721.1 hypothetical protein FDP41_004016 [Naegleria fowleri]CAG4711208.1 unnamed protein product [Naegleria fowleri]